MDGAVKIVEADLSRAEDHAALLFLMDLYARDPMQGGEPLPDDVMRQLVPALLKHPARFVWLAYRNGAPAGFTICFLGFSTFNARPLINIHDISVRAELRGVGVGKMLLAAVESKARALGCCKITLEVRQDNDVARGLYRKLGFDRSVVGATGVPMEFWQKKL
jgi:ribosomal protein S18 acetylase RimI-like enzyme